MMVSNPGAGSSGRLGPIVAGRWYPADTRELSRQVDSLIESSSAVAAGAPPVAIIAPHAGFIYSGSVAASAFRLLRNERARCVILIGPSHYSRFDGAALPSASTYVTPLGEVPLAIELIRQLAERPEIRIDDRPFSSEHSLEAEIPFLQRMLRPGWRLLPVLIGAGSRGQTHAGVARALQPLWERDTLIVVSSDFTHYGHSFGYVPFKDRVGEQLEALDMEAVRLILAGDGAKFDAFLSRTGATICGHAAIDVLLRMAPPLTATSMVAYDTSGRLTGNWDHSVSYASLIFRRPERD
jgi:AmmeMemoRadiSam system protein B